MTERLHVTHANALIWHIWSEKRQLAKARLVDDNLCRVAGNRAYGQALVAEAHGLNEVVANVPLLVAMGIASIRADLRPLKPI